MDRKFIYRYVITLLMLACVFGGKAQLTLTLERTITLAADSSLDAFRYKNMYLAGYWEYRTYKAGRLPSLTLNLTPAQYRRYFTQRYDSEADIDVYRKQQSFYAGGQLEIEQNFDLLGGTFYLDTDLDYMRYFGDQTYNQFSSVPMYFSLLFGSLKETCAVKFSKLNALNIVKIMSITFLNSSFN